MTDKNKDTDLEKNVLRLLESDGAVDTSQLNDTSVLNDTLGGGGENQGLLLSSGGFS